MTVVGAGRGANWLQTGEAERVYHRVRLRYSLFGGPVITISVNGF